nr:hypothetical protein [Tanacetum cinerariifolium]
MSSIPQMTSPIIDLTSRPESPKVHQQFKATTTKTTTTTTLPPPPAQQQSTTEAMMMKRIGKLEHIMANLIQENKGLEERLDNHGARLYTLEQLDIPHQVSKAVSEVVTEAVDWDMQAPLQNRPSGALRAPEAFGSSQVPPPPPPPSSTNQESQSKGSATPSSSKTAASAEYQAWTTTDDMCLITHIFNPLKKTKKRTKSDQNGQKREAWLKKYSKKDKIGSKPDKNEKRGEDGKS